MAKKAVGSSREAGLDPISKTGKSFIAGIAELDIVKPLYTIKQYSESIYSVCKFKRSDWDIPYHFPKEEQKENDEKLDNNFARARSMIKQYGLCNPWDYFLTLTLDPSKYNRFNLEEFRADLNQFVRDERKRYKRLYNHDTKLQLVLVPENHKDGAWHMHGFLYGLPGHEITSFVRGKHPDKLVKVGFENWTRYADKFGFCSLGKIRDQISTVFYMCKYINKDIKSLRDMKGGHLYFPTRGLKTAQTVNELYLPVSELDKYLTYESKFCSTGMVMDEDWTFPIRYDDALVLFPPQIGASADMLPKLKSAPLFDPATIDPGDQLTFMEVF